jgi:hypothetical protein
MEKLAKMLVFLAVIELDGSAQAMLRMPIPAS